MLPSAQVSSISSDRRTSFLAGAQHELAAALASWRAMMGERLYHMGIYGGMATWLVIPLFQIVAFSVIYGSDSALFAYVVVAQAANAFIMNTFYFVGEILDRERVKGTLVSLFLAPCARVAWLSGFILAGVLETMLVSTAALLFGRFAFGVRLDPNLPAVALTMVLFLVALWGIGVIFSGLGLLIRKANPLSNLAWSFVVLFGGIYYPVSELPDALRYPARALPFGYGLEALAAAMLDHASVAELAPQLAPLAVFAVTTPVAGVLAFRWLERIVRVRGELDLY